ncbi:MAG: Na+/H+ antiporter subunit C [Enhydrobacter sp.]|nr:MAG: Na+/H+ antiporter subunit C [Enhydrobacter sp.]
MEIVAALGVGALAGFGIWLLLQVRSFSVILGLTLLSYAVNLLIFFGGRLGGGWPPLMLREAHDQADPLPQALVLTAIVIGFGMTAYLVALALRAKGESGSDHVDAGGER